MRDKLKTNGWLNAATVRVACKEEPVERTVEDDEDICNDITGKNMCPEAVQKARREQLEFMNQLGVMKDVPVEKRWQEAHTRPIERKWIDINKGDGDRVDDMSRRS